MSYARHRAWRWALGALLAAILVPHAARAGFVEETRGHLHVGYARGTMDGSPQGSVSFGAGLDYPLKPDLAVGVNLDYHLLGSGQVRRGILEAEVDYTLFAADAALHWRPAGYGPLRIVSLLAGVYGANAEVTTAPGGSTFINLGRSDAAPGLGAALTFMPARPATIRLGLELAGHLVVLDGEDWSLAAARLVVHY